MKLHEKYAGRTPAKEVQGISGARIHVKCAFCDKMFATETAASHHEATRHRKKLKQLLKEQG